MLKYEKQNKWKNVELGKVCKLKNGFAFKSSDYDKVGVPVIRISDIKQGAITTENSVKVVPKVGYEEFIINRNDILIAMSGATTGKFGIYKKDEKAYQNQRVGNFQILDKSALDNKFLFYLLHNLKRKIEKDAYGGAQPNISSKKIEALEIPLPPLPVQEHIVAKIEELFSELDKGVEQLQTLQKQLKVYRQSVLKYAFEGKLTAEWRTQNPSRQTAAELLESIKAEREAQAKAQGKKLKHIAPLTPAELAELPELPEGWLWVCPEHVASPERYSLGIGPFGSNLKVSDYRESGVPLIFVRNITQNNFDLGCKFISDEKFEELLPHSVKPLDLVITKMGDPPGDCTIYPEKRQEAVITSDCLKFRVWDTYFSREYFSYCINSTLVKKQLGLITQGVAQKKISLERFKTVLFPIPSTDEQYQTVQEIEQRLSIADQVEQTIASSLKQAEALRQSILKKAFSGELVPQEEQAKVQCIAAAAEQLQLF